MDHGLASSQAGVDVGACLPTYLELFFHGRLFPEVHGVHLQLAGGDHVLHRSPAFVVFPTKLPCPEVERSHLYPRSRNDVHTKKQLGPFSWVNF